MSALPAYTPIRPGPLPRVPGRVIPGPWRPPLRPYTPLRAPFGTRPPVVPVGPRVPGIGFGALRLAGWIGIGFQIGWWLGDVFPWRRPQPAQVPSGYTWSYDCPAFEPPYNTIPSFHHVGVWGSPMSNPPGAIYECLGGQIESLNPPYPPSWGFGYTLITGPVQHIPGTGVQRMAFDKMYFYKNGDYPYPFPSMADVPGVALPLPPLQIPSWLDPNRIPFGVPSQPEMPSPWPMKPPVPGWRPFGDPSPWELPEAAPIPISRPPVFPAPAPVPGLPYVAPPVEVPVPGRPTIPRPGHLPSIDIPVYVPPLPTVRPSPRPKPTPGTKPVPGGGPRPGGKPGAEPAPKPRPQWGTHISRPPNSPRERERKSRGPGFGGLLWRIVNGVTEMTDVINAMYKALPWQMRRFKGRDGRWRDKAITPQDRSRAIWDFAGVANDAEWNAFLVETMKNVAMNEIEDMAIGKLVSGRTRAYKRNASIGLEPNTPTGIGV